MQMESEPPFLERYKTLFENLMVEKNIESVDEEPIVAQKHELPLIDLSRLSLSHLHQKECEKEIFDAAKEWGFFQVVNHGICPDILVKMQYEQVKLFQQPFSKKANLSAGSYRWGNPAATTLKQFSWSEAFHIPVSNISEFRDFSNLSSTIEEFTEVVSEVTQRIAEILAENLGCLSMFSAENFMPSSCYLRLNRYPPCPMFSKAYGLVPHTDSGFLTTLYQDQLGGLQLEKDGDWISVKPNPDALVFNIGDLFQAWSNGVYKSIKHRVLVNREVERFSVAYFFCPSTDTVIQTCTTTDQPSIYREFSFGEYKRQVQEDVKSTGSKIGLLRFLK